MKITFDHSTVNQNVDRATTAYRDIRQTQSKRTGDYALDISGTVMDNNAYKGQGKTAEEVMQNAGAIDVATQTDFMTVMSNAMSGEDFARLQKEGYHPGDMEIEEVVTIVDQIKAALVKGGTQVVGYTDDLDSDTLAQITGSAAFGEALARQFQAQDIPLTEENVAAATEAFKRAMETPAPTEGAVKYMVANGMPPTIDNLYLASHSAATDSAKQGHGYYQTDKAGYYAKKAEDCNWEQLRPQIERTLAEADLPVSEENVKGAQWLISVGVPLTAQSVKALHEIEQIEQPLQPETVLSAVAAAISDGKKAGDANLSDGRSTRQQAADYAAAEGITGEAVDLAAAEGKPLNLRNLLKAQQKISLGSAAKETPASITGRRQLEEIRLMMTIQANRKLMESGYSIDTTELAALVEALKKQEQEQNQRLFGEPDIERAAEKASLFAEVQRKTAEIPALPAATLGQFVDGAEAFTIDRVHENGIARRKAYEEARESYETLMTAPRADMGDSIRKAFRNVDDILTDLGYEGSEANRRAVRILGYNSMEVTPENIDAVKEKDLTLRETIRKMTPAASLQAIRDGKNPLSMSMEELNQYLDESGLSDQAGEEKYSRFLYKLEQSHQVSEQEREAYIGIYRMFRQLEKTDDAAVGSLLKGGAEITFSNLMTALRSVKKQGMDYRLDDHFNGVDGNQEKSITDQILSGFPHLGQESAAGGEGQGQQQRQPEQQSQAQQQGRQGQTWQAEQAGRQQGQRQESAEQRAPYYKMLAGQIADALEPESLAKTELAAQTSMEAFAEALARQQADDSLEQAYRQEQLVTFRGLEHVEEAVVQELLAYKQPVTARNLAAAEALRRKPGALYRKLRDLEARGGEEASKEGGLAAALLDSLTDKDSAQKAYEEMNGEFSSLAEEAAREATDYLDLRALQSCKRQLSLAGSLARQENYQIPVEINGELTAINLKVLHGGETGKVSITAQTEGYGQISAKFSMKGQTVSGYIACDSKEGTEWLQGRGEGIKAALAAPDAEGNPRQVEHLAVVQGREVNVEQPGEAPEGGEVQTAQLYRLAKDFITALTAS